VTLPQSVERAIISHAIETSPAECCGLLLGHDAAIVEAARARNVADEPSRRYLIDPSEHLRQIRRGRQRGLEVIGAYHSHPRSGPEPSETDRAAGFSDFVFVIIGLGSATPELAAWRWAGGNFAPIPLVRST
jgi:desampylase